jgi:predicted enzyme related to lactoylglutathione lyase
MDAQHTLSEIRQIALTVSDVSTALPFYRDVLGLTFLFSPAPTLAFLAAGSVRLMLTTPQGAGTAGHNSILYFKVTDIRPPTRRSSDAAQKMNVLHSLPPGCRTMNCGWLLCAIRTVTWSG